MINKVFSDEIIFPFLDILKQFPDRNAFCIKEEFYTYRQFAEHISKIRFTLKQRKITGNIVGLVANDDIETYASIFSLWLEGMCYVPLNIDQQLERSMDIVVQVEANLILDSSAETCYPGDLVVQTKDLPFIEDCVGFDGTFSDEELSYILFTSGSTGKPKGVAITRRNISAFIKSFFDIGYVLTEEDRVLQCFDLSFDLSVVSYLVPLLKGACVYIVPNKQVKYSYIYGLMDDHKLTVALLVPSTLQCLRPYFGEIEIPSMRYSLFCGEALPLDITSDWAKCVPSATIDNFYGPTEDTIFCSHYRYNRNGHNKHFNGVISIGKPMTGGDMKIFDENFNESYVGELGELCLSGNQLTPGYLNNDKKNQDVFFIKDNVRWYKTGDKCFVDSGGDFLISGRLDNQVKIQGYRVELGEIEYHAKEFLKDRNVVAIAFNNQANLTEMALIIESGNFDPNNLIIYLRSKLPSYVVPTKFLFVPIFPLNNNGKTDRNQLKRLIK